MLQPIEHIRIIGAINILLYRVYNYLLFRMHCLFSKGKANYWDYPVGLSVLGTYAAITAVYGILFWEYGIYIAKK